MPKNIYKCHDYLYNKEKPRRKIEKRVTRTSLWEKLSKSSLESNENFRITLKEILKKLRLDTKELSKLSGISESSLYKILTGNRSNPRLSTYRKIVNAIKNLEGYAEKDDAFIAIIAARSTLDAIKEGHIEIEKKKFQLREYAAMTIEDAIVAAIRAQNEGAQAIVCAPIVGSIIEKVIKIPISTCPVALCKEPIIRAAETVAAKIQSK